MLSIILAAFLVFIVVAVFRKPKKWNNAPPGPHAIPLIGNLRQLASGPDPIKKIQAWKEEYGDIAALQFGQYRMVLLSGYENVKEAYNMWEFSGRPLLKPFHELTGGEKVGLILSEGQGWTEQRRFALRNLRDFGFGKKSMESVIHEDITDLMENFKEHNGKPFVPHRKFSTAIFRSLWTIMSGERFPYGDPRFQSVLDGLHSVISVLPVAGPVFFLPWIATLFPERTGWNGFISALGKAKDLMRRYISDHKETFQSDNIRDLMDTYLKEIQDTTDHTSSFYKEKGEKNMLIAMLNLLGAGAEPTSNTMIWVLLFLTKYPEVQEKVYQEILSKIGNSRMPSLDDRDECVYAWAFMEEVHRTASMVPMAIFHNTMQPVTYKAYQIPKDTLVWSNLYGLHFDKKIWGDPENFRPERFLLKNTDGSFRKNLNAGPVVPFGIGKRTCLGEVLARNNVFLYLTSLVQKFKFLPENGDPSSISMEASAGLVRVPKKFKVVANERE